MAVRRPTIRQRVMDWAGNRVARMMWETGRLRNVPARDSIAYARLFNIGGWYTSDKRPLIKPTPANLRRFGKTPYGRAAIRRIKDPIATLQWEIGCKPGVKVNSELQRQIDIATRCFEEPNYDDSHRTFLEQTVEDMCVNGAGSYEHQIGADEARPLWMWPVDSMSIQLNPAWSGKDTEARYYQTIGYGNIGGVEGIPLRNSELVYIRCEPTTENPFGLGALEVAFAAINRKLGVEDFAGKLASAASPENMLVFPGMATEHLLAMRDWWRNEIEGQGQIPMVGSPSAEKSAQPLAVKLRGSDDNAVFLEYQEFLIREIATAFRISPLSLGVQNDVNRNCYSADTETLTLDGWKSLEELTPDMLVGSFNPTTRRVEFCRPESVHIAPYVGDMIHVSGDMTDCLVTPDHRMWVRVLDRDEGSKTEAWDQYEILPAAALEGRRRFAAVASFGNHLIEDYSDQYTIPGCQCGGGVRRQYPDRTVALDDWLAFLGFFLAEGHAGNHAGRWKVNIAQNPGPVADWVDALLSRLPFAFAPNDDDACRRWQVADKALCQHLLAECGDGSHTKRIPKWVLSLPPEKLRIVYDAMMSGDGTRDKREDRTACIYYTASATLRDDVQLLATYLGHRAVATMESTAGIFRVKITEGRTENSIYGIRNVTRVPYTGDVYCFSVAPHHLFVTRRNGRIAVHGNTAEVVDDMDWDNAVVPMATNIAAHITRETINTRLGFSQLEYRYIGLKRDDKEAEADIYETEYQNNAIVPDEYRERNRLPPLKGQWGKMTYADAQIAIAAAKGANEIDDPSLPKGRKGASKPSKGN